jgi:hypothetical protein
MLILSSRQDGDGRASVAHLTFTQTIRGLPVINGGGGIAIDTTTGEVIEAGFTFVPDRGLPAKPKISAEAALRIAAEAVESPTQAAKGTVATQLPQLKYYRSHRKRETAPLVWEVHTSYQPRGADPNLGSTIVLVDATEGLAIEALPGAVQATGQP